MPPVLVVAAGGVAGALARAAVDAVVGREPGEWVWSTLLVNAVGAFALAALLTARGPSLLLGAGALGSFTTFSAFAVDAVLLADGGSTALAVGYVALGVLSLLAAAAAGARVGRAA